MKDELERLMMAHSPRLWAILEAARERIQAGAGIPDEEFWKDIEGTRKPKKNGPKVSKEREP
jgi:hypothetical protein